MIDERRHREEYALEIAKQKVSLQNISAYINLQYRRAEYGLQHPESQFVISYFVAEALKDLLMKEHKEYKASVDCVREVEMQAPSGRLTITSSMWICWSVMVSTLLIL